jgi:hypothetical protein
MNKRSKIWAILGASVLTLGIAGLALAEDLKTYDPLISVDANGNVSGFDADKVFATSDPECDGFGDTIGEGQVGFHFVLSPTNASSGNLTVDWSTGSVGPIASTGNNNGQSLQWFVVVDYPVTLNDASTDVDDTNAEVDGLKVSHICVDSTSTTTTSFSSSEESTTTSVSSSTESTTSFSSSQQSTTTIVTQPPTDTIGDSGSGNQATGMWLLVAALGVLLGSLVVVAPARAKSKR